MGATRDPLAHLPHREPFRFLTEVISIDAGGSGQAIWRVAGDEDFLRGHFPDDPIVPGVLLIEALAQLSGLIGRKEGGPEAAGRFARLAHADVRFDSTVRPPTEVRLESEVARSWGRLTMFDVAARVGTDRVARGTVTLAMLGSPESDR